MTLIDLSKLLTTKQAGEMYTPKKTANYIKTLCNLDKKKEKNLKKYPNAFKISERMWLIPIQDVINDLLKYNEIKKK